MPEAPESVATRLVVEPHRWWEAQRWHRLQQDPPGRVRATVGPHGPILRHQVCGTPGLQGPPAGATLHLGHGRRLWRGAWSLERCPSSYAPVPTARHALAHLLVRGKDLNTRAPHAEGAFP